MSTNTDNLPFGRDAWHDLDQWLKADDKRRVQIVASWDSLRGAHVLCALVTQNGEAMPFVGRGDDAQLATLAALNEIEAR